MPLDPFLAAKLPLLAGIAGYPPVDGEQEAALAAFDEDPAPWTPPPSVTVEPGSMDGPHGAIPVRFYRPDAPSETTLLWVHGGGFSGGDLDMRESHVVASELAARAGATVVTVGYRLAGDDVRYPVPLDDVHAVWMRLADELPTASTRVIGGASAGAALALATALRVRDDSTDAPDRILLAYPFAHFPNPALHDAVAREMMALPPLLRFLPSSVESMVRTYVGRISDLPPDALPGAARLEGLPPTVVLFSEFDDLRSSAELLILQLEEAGVQVTSDMARGMLHGHLNRTPSLAEVDRSLTFFADALR